MVAILIDMATTTVKSTYSLDVASIRRLESLARTWQVSKSEVIRRALRIAVLTAHQPEEALAAAALDRVQHSVRERGVDLVAQWERELKAERRANEPGRPPGTRS